MPTAHDDQPERADLRDAGRLAAAEVQHGHDLLGAALILAGHLRHDIGTLPGLRVLREELLGAEASHDLDPLHVVIDISGLAISGYDAADWLREHQRVDVGSAITAASRPPYRCPATRSSPRRKLSTPPRAVGRICAEQITPDPPGIPVIIPGERIAAELLDHLRSGVNAGMQLPDAADPALDTIRVVSADGA